MEALSVDEIPTGDGWQYEPKWDGFRCLVFRDGDKVELQSKSGRPLTRTFSCLLILLCSLFVLSALLDTYWICGLNPFSRLSLSGSQKDQWAQGDQGGQGGQKGID
jgi:ATP-dependent DNA ligase